MPKQAKSQAQSKKQLVDSRVKRAEQGKLVYRIDCSIPFNDDVVTSETMTKFATYLTEHLKVGGKTGQLGGKCEIAAEEKQIVVTKFKVLFAKRYLKFLTRKFLKKEKLRDYLRPVSTKKHDYQLRYYNIHLDDEAEE
eukprot:TRINITY_DN32758_c0_g1_i2.p1 TRINITY_DN32758_c0_g1~~TRINITY_DN32758_c0_g1_i2.p1  ORF type:complete len:138 (+),score=78.70 TRINITY_DN32758_c0_g1_i2:137-550(+)